MNSLLLLGIFGVTGCSDYEFYNQKYTDVFQQNGRNQVDVLLVVDNSCSMFEEQDKLATNFDSFIQYFDGVEVDYQISVVTTDTVQEQFSGRFVGGDDEIRLTSATGAVIDRVEFTREWGIVEGVSMSLDPSLYSATSNDSMESWCPSSSSYGAGDLGTPGGDNDACGAKLLDSGDSGDSGTDDTASPDDTGAPQDVGTAPKVGQIIITEFMADPGAVADNQGEWVELRNITSDVTLNLSGMHLSDSGRNDFTLPDGTSLAPGATLVLARSSDSDSNGGLDSSLAMGEDFTLNNNVVVITPQTEGAAEIFSEMVAQGTSGAGIEMGYHAAQLGLSEPLLSTVNAGFLRDDANLSLIFVSDEDDDSALPVNDYLRFFTELKGPNAYRDHQRFNISAVVGERQPEFSGEPSCSSADGVADFGKRYVDLANRTEGLVESICDQDFSPIAAELGLILSGLAVEFELSGNPNPDSFEVNLYESEDLDSFLRTLEEDVDWTYVPERNSIRFEEGQVPAPNTYITVEYELRATGTETTDEGTN